MTNKLRLAATDRLAALEPFRSLIPFDPYTASFELVAKRVQLLSTGQRKELLLGCRKLLSESRLRRMETVRVAATKILVALVPESSDTIRHWIRSKPTADNCEVQFSLFCFLGYLPLLPSALGLKEELPALLEWYLLNMRSDAASAAWMAGDLLGDHWELKYSLPILSKVAETGRFAVGRLAAVHGIAHALGRVTKSRTTVKTLTELLNRVKNTDRSGKVRQYARGVIIQPAAH